MIVTLAMVIVFGGNSFAQDDEKSSQTLIYLTGEETFPENGDDFFGWKIFGKHYILRNSEKIGGFGLEYKTEPDNDYWKMQGWGFIALPYQYDLSLGYSEKSNDARFVFLGIDRLFPKVAGTNWSFFIDAKNFFALNDKGEGYLDIYTSILYPFGKRFKAGANVVYDHYWTGESRERFFLGPVAQYRFTENFSIRARVGRNWDWRDRGDTYNDQIRLDLKFFF